MDGEHAHPWVLPTEPSLFPAAWQQPLWSHGPFGKMMGKSKGEHRARTPEPVLSCSMGWWGCGVETQ